MERQPRVIRAADLFSFWSIPAPELALNRAWGFKERGIIRQYAVYLVLVIVCTLIILFPVLIGSFVISCSKWRSGNRRPARWLSRS
ncbi:MAG: hypothetical protein IPG76_20345 [Acidobacteria bacterium]|nr:hypothetical protein [Acidobacteriota bacterium]